MRHRKATASVLSTVALFIAAVFAANSQTAGFPPPAGVSFTSSPQDQKAATSTQGEDGASRDVPAISSLISENLSLNVARRNHTATALADGRVIIIGGDTEAGAVSEAEMLDPSSKTLSVVASSFAPRTQHAATLLADGRVLVTGGTNQAGVLNSTEIFDPQTDSFWPGPSLQKARAGHSATLLDDGRVLIAGGDADGSAELFDPITNQSSLVKGKMTARHEGHSAILLADGNVLLVGGEAGGGHHIESAEVFNANTSSFSATAIPLLIERARPTLRLLPDGKVQVIGGDYDGTMEVYDPATGRFGAVAHLVPTADIFSPAEMMSAQTRAGFIDSISYRDPNVKRITSQSVNAAVETFKKGVGRKRYATAEIPGSDQAVIVGGVGDDKKLDGSALLLKSFSATISTDKVEYLADDAPVITGRGWKPFEKITIVRQEARLGHKRRILHAVANKRGNFTCRDLTAADYRVWVTYTLTARGESSKQIAQTSYIDAPMPGKEMESLGRVRFQFPLTTRDGSIETETVLFKWKTTWPSIEQENLTYVTSAVSCAIPTGNQFNLTGDFTNVKNQPCLGIDGNPCGTNDIRFKDICMAMSGSVSVDFCVGIDPPCLSASATVEEDFKGAGTLVFDLKSGFNFNLLNIPIPALSITGTVGPNSGVELTGGVTLRAKINATVTTPTTIEVPFEFSEGHKYGFDTEKDPVGVDEQTTPSVATGSVIVTKPGTASAKLSFGPNLGLKLKAGITLVDFGLGILGFVQPALTDPIDTATCKAGKVDLHAGIDLNQTAKLIEVINSSKDTNLLNIQVPGFPKNYLTSDTAPPTINVSNIIQGTDPGQCSAQVFYSPTFADNCSGIDTSSVSINPPSGSTFQKGTTTVNVSVKDIAGNLATTSFTVTVEDKQAPSISCPANITKETDPGLCSAVVNFTPTATDNCDGSITFICTPPSGTAFSKGTTSVTCTATDASGNVSQPCSFTVTVNDMQKPLITCKDVTHSTDPDKCTAVVTFAPTVSDSCPDVGAPTCTPVSGSTFQKGTTTVNCTVSDASGNSESCSFTVTVNDAQAPSITCPDITRSTDTDKCNSVVTFAPTVSDNCPDVGAPTCTPASGSTFLKGTTTVNCTVTDTSGNSQSCSFTVTVNDTQPPVARCKNATVFLDASGNASISVANIDNGSTDNCDIASYALSKTSFNCTNIGPNLVTLTVTDTSGNSNSCTATVTVVDNLPPQITNLTATPSSLWPPNHKMRDVTLSYTSTDNCGVVSCMIAGITSNEPEDGTGDGDTSPDWEIVDPNHARLRAERSGNSNGRIYTITVRCTDAVGNWTEASVNVVVAHNITAPVSGAVFKINTPVTFSGTFWDVPGRTHTAQWVLGSLSASGGVVEPSGLTPGTVTGSYIFEEPGIYKVRLNITDDRGETSYVTSAGDLEAIVVVYDPSAGYTIGGGWITSPAGAFTADPSLSGKVGFGFNSKYFKNATNPKGEAWTRFNIGDFEFNALNYEYLVISGAKAHFKGFGKINGSAGYEFTLTVIDGDLEGGGGVDKVRLKIWNKSTGEIIYDNQMGASDADDPITEIGSGNIVIHQ